MRSRRHRSRARRFRLKERVRQRYRKKQWRRVLVGLAVLVGVGLVIAGAGWGAMYIFARLQSGNARQIEAEDQTPLAEPRLIGEWQSDPDASIAEMRRTQTVSARRRKAIEEDQLQDKSHVYDKDDGYRDGPGRGNSTVPYRQPGRRPVGT